ncbi:MAG TPA: hypothetical protein VF529_19645 [Solirubrobacteraceae bacterium]|jgi:hypothetical protein
MKALAIVAAGASLTSAAFAADRALRATDTPAPGLTIDAGEPIFALEGLRHGDRAERCVTLRNEGPGDARATISGREEDGDLAPLLRASITRGCDDPTLLWSGTLDRFGTVADEEPWPQGAARRYGLAVEVAGEDDEIAGRHAVHEFAFAAETAEGRGGGETTAPPAVEERAPSASPPPPATCTTISFAKTKGGRRKHPVLIKYHRISGRVQAKLILRIYGAIGQQRLVLVTGLRIGRVQVLMGRRWGRVTYRVAAGAPVTSRTRPFRVRIAPGVLKPGRNVVRVATIRKRGKPVRARYVLNIAAAARGEKVECRIG